MASAHLENKHFDVCFSIYDSDKKVQNIWSLTLQGVIKRRSFKRIVTFWRRLIIIRHLKKEFFRESIEKW